jgi:flavin-dependent dehydrogenase
LLYDVAIIGGGPAGLSTALHLQAAAPGTKLVVLEAKTYPRDKICAGGIGARAFRILEKLDVEVSCPMVKIDNIALRLGSDTAVANHPGLGVVVRRFEFDHAFAKLAMARGIEIREGTPVTSLEFAEDEVRIGTEAGQTIRARCVVGADGVSGVVRRLAGFPRGELRAQVVELDTETHETDQPRDTIVFDYTMQDLQGYAWDFPTIVGGNPLMCRGAYVIYNLGPDSPKQRIARYLADRGMDLASYKLKQFAERGFEPGVELAMPRVLLVGEAAGIDIATGEGIGQAIEYGSLAGPYLASALADDNLRFSSWTKHINSRHLGWQMKIRHTCYRAFYSERRVKAQRILPKLTSLFRVAVEDFAGTPMSKLAIAHGAGQFLAAYAREKMRDDA